MTTKSKQRKCTEVHAAPRQTPWSVDEMTPGEVVNTAHSYATMARDARQYGDGISSKDTIRFRRCIERLTKERFATPEVIAELQIQWNPARGPFRDLLITMARNGTTYDEMRQLFEPA